MYLDEFFNYKNQLMNDLLTNENIVKLLSDDISLEDAGSLVYTQVFPYEYVPETIEHGHTFICSDVDISASPNNTKYNLTLYVWIFTHKSKLRLPEGGVRTDKLAHEIAKTINGNHYYGFGELDLRSVKRFAPLMDFQGKVLIIEAQDFNKPRPTFKPIPSNRERA